MIEEWLPIRYREFYDFPRVFVLANDGKVWLFDSPFSELLDDYADTYDVYIVDERLHESIDAMPWGDLANQLTRVATIKVESVRFDSTKRKEVNASIFDRLQWHAG